MQTHSKTIVRQASGGKLMRIAVIFDNLGPYHIARLSAASAQCELLGVEVAQRSANYGWHPTATITAFHRTVLMEQGTRQGMDRNILAARLHTVLSKFRPEAVAIPGWSYVEAILALRWCVRNRVPVILMSESQEVDETRTRLKEWFKGRYLALCPAALVGGESHRAYLLRLGMSADRVFLGYDAVDNGHFACGAATARADAIAMRRKLSLPQHYFLASNRFISKKNLPVLLRAFARYREDCTGTPWDLVLLGDGPLRGEIEALIAGLDLDGSVRLPGFRQYDELPAYYGLAGAFVHASTSEQWGLVVNEAMASGLPVLVSKRCGCASELVHHGINGYQFDPADTATLSQDMAEITRDEGRRRVMGNASRERIGQWGPDRFAQGLREAAECARRAGPPQQRLIDSLILQTLIARRT